MQCADGRPAEMPWLAALCRRQVMAWGHVWARPVMGRPVLAGDLHLFLPPSVPVRIVFSCSALFSSFVAPMRADFHSCDDPRRWLYGCHAGFASNSPNLPIILGQACNHPGGGGPICGGRLAGSPVSGPINKDSWSRGGGRRCCWPCHGVPDVFGTWLYKLDKGQLAILPNALVGFCCDAAKKTCDLACFLGDFMLRCEFSQLARPLLIREGIA